MPCYTSTIKTMEININCDLGEKSKHHSNKYDPDLLEIVNSANVACGYHAGDAPTMHDVVQISKKNGVSIGAHPSFNDPENFGRERMNLSSSEIRKLIIDQYEILQKIADNYGEKVTHIKPHGALNNMACEDIELATTLAKAINEISKDLIYLVPTGSKMEVAAKKLNMKIACEIFADRNYEDDGNLVSRKKPHALITDPEEAKKHVLNMVKNQSLNCHSGKQIPCEIDSVCIHGDNESSLATARSIRENLLENGLKLKPLNQMNKFI
ncbi:LamB/YcsF family protein [Candidatus Pelagibacter sp.]|nr:LamB/YcsF family protein [Candidatus Pelagibacter sp.]